MSTLKQFLIDKNFHRIKFKISESNHLFLEASINGQKGTFLLDTGASATCVDKAFVNEFGLIGEKEERKVVGTGPTSLTMEISTKNDLEIGGWKKSKNDLIIFDMSHVNNALEESESPRSHGIIGADILKNGKAIIDYKKKCLYLK